MIKTNVALQQLFGSFHPRICTGCSIPPVHERYKHDPQKRCYATKVTIATIRFGRHFQRDKRFIRFN